MLQPPKEDEESFLEKTPIQLETTKLNKNYKPKIKLTNNQKASF